MKSVQSKAGDPEGVLEPLGLAEPDSQYSLKGPRLLKTVNSKLCFMGTRGFVSVKYKESSQMTSSNSALAQAMAFPCDWVTFHTCHQSL